MESLQKQILLIFQQGLCLMGEVNILNLIDENKLKLI